jgi:hypothetical protein
VLFFPERRSARCVPAASPRPPAAAAAAAAQGFSANHVRVERFLNLRYTGTDVAVMTPCPDAGSGQSYGDAFAASYRRAAPQPGQLWQRGRAMRTCPDRAAPQSPRGRRWGAAPQPTHTPHPPPTHFIPQWTCLAAVPIGRVMPAASCQHTPATTPATTPLLRPPCPAPALQARVRLHPGQARGGGRRAGARGGQLTAAAGSRQRSSRCRWALQGGGGAGRQLYLQQARAGGPGAGHPLDGLVCAARPPPASWPARLARPPLA